MTSPRPKPSVRAPHTPPGSTEASWSGVRDDLRARGLRWTPQRRTLVEVLSKTHGHVTGVQIVERCRAIDPETTPSTVYRTLDVLEDLGLIRHGHGADGREEFHVLPAAEHGHIYCRSCGGTWEIGPDEATELLGYLAMSHHFAADLSHLTVVGCCEACGAATEAAG